MSLKRPPHNGRSHLAYWSSNGMKDANGIQEDGRCQGCAANPQLLDLRGRDRGHYRHDNGWSRRTRLKMKQHYEKKC
eukprot:3899600-Amphidinium_carterae.1